MDTQEQQRWRQHAACFGQDTNRFFPDRGDNHQAIVDAKKICLGCPVLDDCRRYALGFKAAQLPGVWGGLTQQERKRIQRHTDRQTA